jgi:hypothetical protein
MADKKISGLTPATTPLGGDELAEIVQGGVNKKVAVSSFAPPFNPSDYDLTEFTNNETDGSQYATVHNVDDFVIPLQEQVDNFSLQTLCEENKTSVNLLDSQENSKFFSVFLYSNDPPSLGKIANLNISAFEGVTIYSRNFIELKECTISTFLGALELSQKELTNNQTTKLTFEDPLSNSTWKVPARDTNGTYIFAGMDDVDKTYKKEYLNESNINYLNYNNGGFDVHLLPANGSTNFVFKNEVNEQNLVVTNLFNGFKIPANYQHLFEGKLFILTNKSIAPIQLYSFVADADINFKLEQEYLYFYPNETLTFKYTSEGVLELLYPQNQFLDSTSSSIDFFSEKRFGTVAVPITSNVTWDEGQTIGLISSSRPNLIQKMYHQSATVPTFPAQFVNIGSTSYDTTKLNIMYFEWVDNNRIEYWILN